VGQSSGASEPLQPAQADGSSDTSVEAQVGEVVPFRLTASSDARDGREVLATHSTLSAARAVALEWTGLSGTARIQESLASVAGLEYDRFYLLRRYQSMTGEKLALACTTGVEAELWRRAREGQKHSTEHEMAHRAVIELQAYFLLSAGHDLANITARALALDEALRVDLLEKVGSGFPVGGSSPENYIALNRDTIRGLCRVGRKSAYKSLKGMPEAVSRLFVNSAWARMTEGRHEEFHRERLPSHGSLVLSERAWVTHEGEPTLYIGFPETSTASEGLAQARGEVCMNALAVLANQMRTLGKQIDEALLEFLGPENMWRVTP
jgi:hypothetical protein